MRTRRTWTRVRSTVRALTPFIVLFVGVGLIMLGVQKLFDVRSFAEVIAAHGLFPLNIARLLAPVAAGLEVLVGVAALVSTAAFGRVSSGCWVLATLMLGLSVYCSVVAVRPPSQPVSCGCGLSSSPVESWSALAARNAGGAFLLRLLGLMTSWRKPAPESLSETMVDALS